jgi:hypothetical protein
MEGLMKRAVLFCSVLLAACASSMTPDAASGPSITIAQTSDARPLQAITTEGEKHGVAQGVAPTNRVPVDFRFTLTNPLSEPATLKAVEMETVGFSGGYSLKRVRHNFDHNVPAGSVSTVDVRAWVQPLQQTETGRITSAVMIHGIARFDVGGKTVRKAFSAKLAQGE